MTEKITTSTDDVELTKYSDEEGYYLPAIVYEFASEREDTALVRVVENLPDEIDSTDFGFHKRFGRDDWEWEDDKLVLEAEIDGGSEYKAVFAMRNDAPCEVTALVTPPEEFTVEPAVPTVATPGRGDTFTRSASSNHSGETESATASVATQSATDADEDSRDRSNGEASIFDDVDGFPPSDSDDSETDSDGSETDSESAGRSVVDELIAELEADSVEEDRLEYLQQLLLPAADSPQSVDVRIRQLQNDMADFRAYTNAMEQFIDEHGSAEEVVSQFERRLDSFETTLEAVESSVEDHDTDITAVREETETMQSELESISRELSALEEDVSDLSTELDSLDDRFPEFAIEERIEAVEAEMAEVSGYVQNLKQVFQDQ